VKELARREEQSVSARCVARRHAGMGGGRRLPPRKARLPAQRPFTPNDGVVAKSCKREALCSPPADARRAHGGKRM
jgi:hypothetical protein